MKLYLKCNNCLRLSFRITVIVICILISVGGSFLGINVNTMRYSRIVINVKRRKTTNIIKQNVVAFGGGLGGILASDSGNGRQKFYCRCSFSQNDVRRNTGDAVTTSRKWSFTEQPNNAGNMMEPRKRFPWRRAAIASATRESKIENLHMYNEKEYEAISVKSSNIVVPRGSSSRRDENNSSNNSESDDKYDELLVLGVCGGIASGKSKACKILADHPFLGCVAHIDVDQLAHTVYEPGTSIIDEIGREFGKDVVARRRIEDNDGSFFMEDVVDRKKLGQIVFSDQARMSALERIVWPHVRRKLTQRLDEVRLGVGVVEDSNSSSSSSVGGENQRRRPVAVVEAAMMIESGWVDLFHGLWVVRTPPKLALERLIQHRGLTASDAELRINAQRSRRGIDNIKEEVENGIVTAIIENNSCLTTLTQRLEDAWIDPSCWKKGVISHEAMEFAKFVKKN